MLLTEEWRAVPGWPMYEVSSLGRVRRLARGKGTRPGRVLKTDNAAYPQATMLKGSARTRRTYSVHYLVCSAFHGAPPTPEHEVAHDDGDKKNCRADNLRWATHKENEADKIRHGRALRGARNHNAVLNEKTVIALREAYAAAEKRRGLIVALAKRFRVSFKSAYHVLTGATWRHLP